MPRVSRDFSTTANAKSKNWYSCRAKCERELYEVEQLEVGQRVLQPSVGTIQVCSIRAHLDTVLETFTSETRFRQDAGSVSPSPRGLEEISPNRSRIEPLNHRVYSALTLQRRGNNVSLSLVGEGRGEGARTLDRCSNFPVHGEGRGEGARAARSPALRTVSRYVRSILSYLWLPGEFLPGVLRGPWQFSGFSFTVSGL